MELIICVIKTNYESTGNIHTLTVCVTFFVQNYIFHSECNVFNVLSV